MMASSPPKDLAEVEEQSPDEQEHMERGQSDALQQPPVFDFEVKEQDRWLPIANGECPPRFSPFLSSFFFPFARVCGWRMFPACSPVSFFFFSFLLPPWGGWRGRRGEEHGGRAMRG